MRTHEEILEVIKHPSKFLTSDIYKSAFMEIYSCVSLDELPEHFRNHLSEEAKANWDKEKLPSEGYDFSTDIKDEISYLQRLIKEDLVREACARTPRVFALIWLSGEDVTNLDEKLSDIMKQAKSLRDTKRKLSQLYIKLERKYILK